MSGSCTHLFNYFSGNCWDQVVSLMLGVDAEHLFAHLLGISRMDLHHPLRVESAIAALDDPSQVVEHFSELITRRLDNEPVQYITGLAYFGDLTLHVGPGVLIPRPETELMIDRIVAHLKSFDGPASVIDLGAGYGGGINLSESFDKRGKD